MHVKPDGIYVDGTLGGGGHAFEIAKRLSDKGHLFGFDQDDAAIEAARLRLLPFLDRTSLFHSNFCNMKNLLAEDDVTEVNGIILDLGVSSHQLDESERGFSYRFDAPLDMRMDRRQTLTARDIVNGYSEGELYRVIRDYGEDRFAANIAKHIVRARQDKPVETTFQLNDIIKAAIPAKMRQDGHPSKQTFQAIRIECNRELDVLKNSLDELIGLLAPGGRLCVITFHSLEDRIVKTTFKRNEKPCTCPPGFPVCVCGQVSRGNVITKKPILPSDKELEENSRSKSAKLRVFSRK